MYHTFEPGLDGVSSTVEIRYLKWESRRARVPYKCEICDANVTRVHVWFHSRCKSCAGPGWYFGMALLDYGWLVGPSGGPYASEEDALEGAQKDEEEYRANQAHFAAIDKKQADKEVNAHG